MNVRELIEHLQTLPQELEVIYSYHSDYEVLRAEDIEHCEARGKSTVLRGGRYAHTYPGYQWPPGEQPVYVDVVIFPGN